MFYLSLTNKYDRHSQGDVPLRGCFRSARLAASILCTGIKVDQDLFRQKNRVNQSCMDTK